MTPSVSLPSKPLKPRPVPLWLLGAFLATGAGTLLGLTLEQPLVAVAVPLLAAASWALFRAPLKISATALLFSACLFEGLSSPLAYDYENPLLPIARLVMTNLNQVTGIGALRLPALDLLTLVLVVASFMRRKDRTFVSHMPTVRPLNVALLVSALAVVALDVLGTLQGGNFNESLWQLRQPLLFPVRALLMLRAFDGTDSDIKMVVKALIAAGVIKALIGIWFLYTWIRPFGRDVEFTTAHADTLLFVPLLALYFNLLIERFKPKLLVDGIVWVPIVAFGMICNDRRLAYVCLAISIIATMALSPPTRFKRLLLRAAVVIAPLVPPYVLAGWTSTGGFIFWPARLARSVIIGDPDQGNHADYRDIENVNVLFSWTNNALVPQGFGHKMSLLFDLPDISSAMPTWQYHPHNQYLWLMTIGGPIGFTLMMLPQVITLYLCARTYRVTNDFWVRVFSLTGIAMVASFFCQTYGDMGTLSYSPSWMAALAAAMASKLAVRSGAWPVPPPARQPERTTARFG